MTIDAITLPTQQYYRGLELAQQQEAAYHHALQQLINTLPAHEALCLTELSGFDALLLNAVRRHKYDEASQIAEQILTQAAEIYLLNHPEQIEQLINPENDDA